MTDQSTKSAHTPGPWVAYPETPAYRPPLVRVAKYWPGPGAYQVIADCSYKATSGTDCEANARLIAAAPDMLAALRNLSSLYDAIWVQLSNSEVDLLKAAWAQADAAIAKATGGPIRATNSEIKEELRNEIQASGDC